MRKLSALLLWLCGCQSGGQKTGLGALCLASLVGCQTTPGMTLSWSFTLPPALNNTATLHPVAAMPATAYAVEMPTQAMIQRPYLMQQPVPQPSIPTPGPLPRPAMEPIPVMPKINGGCGGPCSQLPVTTPSVQVVDAQ